MGVAIGFIVSTAEGTGGNLLENSELEVVVLLTAGDNFLKRNLA
jgi:hypothetical protein